jgi:hypothetical protein
MNFLWLSLAFAGGIVTTIGLEILGLKALLEPLRGPLELILGLVQSP